MLIHYFSEGELMMLKSAEKNSANLRMEYAEFAKKILAAHPNMSWRCTSIELSKSVSNKRRQMRFQKARQNNRKPKEVLIDTQAEKELLVRYK
jgi:hypothetical protein